MSPPHRLTTTAAERYDQALAYGHHRRLPADAPRPQPTRAWPPENVMLLARFRAWVVSSGTGAAITDQLYIPMAGHVLGLALKPHGQLDLETDLEPAIEYIQAKGLSAQWTQMCRCALNRFRRFLRQERGAGEVAIRPLNYAHYCRGLPEWLVSALERYQHTMQPHWRPARLNEQIIRFWSGHVRLWRWLCEHHAIQELQDIKRRWLLDYADHRLVAGYAASGVNQDLRYFHAFLLFLQDEDYPVPQALLRVPSVKQPDRLPKFLTDEQVRALRADFEQRVIEAPSPTAYRNAMLDRAAFYLLWQAGLRLGELEELLLEDLDMGGRKLTVRRGKGWRDRVVYLTDTTVAAVQQYLAVRGMGPDSHLFLYHNLPVKKDLVRSRIKLAGERVGVKVYPHRLRHTMATQLLNAGCRITSIQKLMGHRRLNSTMIYARVHDQTEADDYYAAMAHIEARLQLAPATPPASQPVLPDERAGLLALAAALVTPEPTTADRLALAQRMQWVLSIGSSSMTTNMPITGRNERDPPATGFVLVDADAVLVS